MTVIISPKTSAAEKQRVVGDRYVLKVGDAGAARLALLDKVYGAATRQLLCDAGLRLGMRVADLGCGTGTVTRWLAEQVGTEGEVVGLDVSKEQLAVARRSAGTTAATAGRTTFEEGNVYETRLERAAFDMVFCRMLLCHLVKPMHALREMHALLRPGGVLVCQDMDLRSLFSEPANCAYRRTVELGLALGDIRGVDYCFGAVLENAMREAGIVSTRVRTKQPWSSHGEGKRLWEQTFLEAAPAMVDAGLVKQREVDQLAAELGVAASDETTLLAPWKMIGIWGWKTVDPAICRF